jgi:outer membrane lipoprotein SlyB
MKTKIALAALLCAAFSSQSVDRMQLNSTIMINYGTVLEVGRTKIKSNAPSGAIMGGVIGAATSGKHHRGKHALEGVLAGGLLSAVLEGKREAFAYTISLANGAEVKVITEQSDIRVGDCVSFEQGRTTNVRRVSSVHCQAAPTHEVHQDPYVTSSASFDAAQCHSAKEQVLAAKTEAEVDLAVKKVSVFCD